MVSSSQTLKLPEGKSSTLWLFNIAMENGPFTDDFPIKASIYKGFSIAMLNNQRVEVASDSSTCCPACDVLSTETVQLGMNLMSVAKWRGDVMTMGGFHCSLQNLNLS